MCICLPCKGWQHLSIFMWSLYTLYLSQQKCSSSFYLRVYFEAFGDGRSRTLVDIQIFVCSSRTAQAQQCIKYCRSWKNVCKTRCAHLYQHGVMCPSPADTGRKNFVYVTPSYLTLPSPHTVSQRLTRWRSSEDNQRLPVDRITWLSRHFWCLANSKIVLWWISPTHI